MVHWYMVDCSFSSQSILFFKTYFCDPAVGTYCMEDFNHLCTFFLSVAMSIQDMLAVVATACEVCLKFIIFIFSGSESDP